MPDGGAEAREGSEHATGVKAPGTGVGWMQASRVWLRSRRDLRHSMASLQSSAFTPGARLSRDFFFNSAAESLSLRAAPAEASRMSPDSVRANCTPSHCCTIRSTREFSADRDDCLDPRLPPEPEPVKDFLEGRKREALKLERLDLSPCALSARGPATSDKESSEVQGDDLTSK